MCVPGNATMRYAVFFSTRALPPPALDAFFDRVERMFAVGSTGYGGVGGIEHGGEFLLARAADGAAERTRLAEWLGEQPEVLEAYPQPAIGRESP